MVKRKDFNATLKQLTDGLERMCSGNRFHSDGAATANEPAPNFVAVLGMTRSSRVADRSLRLLIFPERFIFWSDTDLYRVRQSKVVPLSFSLFFERPFGILI